MKISMVCLVTALGVACATAGVAQSSTYHQRHSINQRDAKQQSRINKGVADGQITPRGAAAADAHQARLNQEQANMRASDNGHLTAQDRHKISRQQNRTSNRIYGRNHNAATDPGVAPR